MLPLLLLVVLLLLVLGRRGLPGNRKGAAGTVQGGGRGKKGGSGKNTS
jgi:hypothetical protein